MYTKTAEFYDTLYHFKDYNTECRWLHRLIKKHHPRARTLLDVACGTGKHMEYLTNYYTTEGLDLNPELLYIAGERCPQVLLHEADMTDFNLAATFDVVICMFSSIAYVQSVENLRKTVQCMASHLEPGGFIAVEPWFEPEKYWEGKVVANFADQPDCKIAWMYRNEKVKSTSVFDIHYMVGSPEGVARFSEKHTMGLWTADEYRQAFLDAGIDVNYDPKGPANRGMYYGIKR